MTLHKCKSYKSRGNLYVRAMVGTVSFSTKSHVLDPDLYCAGAACVVLVLTICFHSLVIVIRSGQ